MVADLLTLLALLLVLVEKQDPQASDKRLYRFRSELNRLVSRPLLNLPYFLSFFSVRYLQWIDRFWGTLFPFVKKRGAFFNKRETSPKRSKGHLLSFGFGLYIVFFIVGLSVNSSYNTIFLWLILIELVLFRFAFSFMVIAFGAQEFLQDQAAWASAPTNFAPVFKIKSTNLLKRSVIAIFLGMKVRDCFVYIHQDRSWSFYPFAALLTGSVALTVLVSMIGMAHLDTLISSYLVQTPLEDLPLNLIITLPYALFVGLFFALLLVMTVASITDGIRTYYARIKFTKKELTAKLLDRKNKVINGRFVRRQMIPTLNTAIASTVLSLAICMSVGWRLVDNSSLMHPELFLAMNIIGDILVSILFTLSLHKLIARRFNLGKLIVLISSGFLWAAICSWLLLYLTLWLGGYQPSLEKVSYLFAGLNPTTHELELTALFWLAHSSFAIVIIFLLCAAAIVLGALGLKTFTLFSEKALNSRTPLEFLSIILTLIATIYTITVKMIE